MAIAPMEKMGLPPPPGAVNFDPGDNRGQYPTPSVHGDELDSDGHQPQSSAAASKRITRLCTKNTVSRMQKRGDRVRSGPADVD